MRRAEGLRFLACLFTLDFLRNALNPAPRRGISAVLVAIIIIIIIIVGAALIYLILTTPSGPTYP